MTVAASRVIEGAREAVASLLGADPERTLFGSGATFWLNTVLLTQLNPGDRVVVSALEHNAVMRPLRWLEESRGIEVVIESGEGPDGVPTADSLRARATAAPTAMVVLSHASNVTGAVLPVAEIARAVAPVPVVVDGAQTAGSMAFDFADLGVAAYTCSGHKGLLGPPGSGVLLLAPGFDIDPLVRGGTGSNSESEEMPDHLPDSLEAGTPNGAGIAGLGAACRWLADRGIEAVAEHERRLVRRLADGLREIPAVRLHGWRDGAAAHRNPQLHRRRARQRRARRPARPRAPDHAPRRPALRSRRPPPARHLPRRHPPRRDRPVQHRRRCRCVGRGGAGVEPRVRRWERSQIARWSGARHLFATKREPGTEPACSEQRI